MNKSEAALLELIKKSLFDAPVNFPDDVDWGEVFKEAQAQTVVSLVTGAIPQEDNDRTTLFYQSKAHFMHVLYEQTKLMKLLEDAGIRFAVIKGCAAAMYYPNPSSREMGDIDVLVEEGSFDAAFDLLSSNGYEYDHGSDGREYTFVKNGIPIELHNRYSDDRHDIESFLIGAVKNAERHVIYENTFYTLPKPENGLVLLDHIRHHFFGGIGLRHLIDFMMFVYSEPSEERFIKEYLPLFERAGLKTFACVIAKTCKKYLGLPASVGWCECVDDKTCDELMETVLKKGNFGRKTEREVSPFRSVTIEFRRIGFFRTLQNSGMINFGICQKYKIFRPFAWLFQLFRYAFKAFAAVFRREKVLDDVSAGRKTADFYKRLGIM